MVVFVEKRVEGRAWDPNLFCNKSLQPGSSIGRSAVSVVFVR